jgi:hypothetical protein
MIENVMHSIGGMSMYGVISSCLFFAVFLGVLIWTFSLRQPYLKSMRELPLDGEPAAPSEVEPPPNPYEHHD